MQGWQSKKFLQEENGKKTYLEIGEKHKNKKMGLEGVSEL